MNKEALKSIYAYNMLFNNVSGNDTTDNNVKLNTNLISDFDLQNFNPKRFEYYTTLLKMFDNDQETLEKLLAKYNSVKSLRVKERKLIREINDYVNKINKTKTVGGGAEETTCSTLKRKIDELKIKINFPSEQQTTPINEEAVAGWGTIVARKANIKPLNTSKGDQKNETSNTKNKYKDAINTFDKAKKAFDKDKDIDNFEESINVLDKFIKSATFMSGGISNEKTKDFLRNIKDHNEQNIKRPQVSADMLDLFLDIIRLARKYVEESRKNLIDPLKEKNDIAGSLKAQVFSNPALKELLKVALQKEAEKSSAETDEIEKESDILSALASVLEAYTKEYVAFADLQVEKAKQELEKAEAVLASLPDKREEEKKYKKTLKNRIDKEVANKTAELSKIITYRKGLYEKYSVLNNTPIPPDKTKITALKIIRDFSESDKKNLKEYRLTEQEIEDYKIAKTQQEKLLDIAKRFSPIQVYDIPNIIIIQNAVKAAELALNEIKDEATKAKDASEIVKGLLDQIKEYEKNIGDKAKEAKRASKNPDLVGEEKAKKAKNEAGTLIIKATDLVKDLEAQKLYAYNCAMKVDDDADAYKRVVDEVKKATAVKDSAQFEVNNLILAKAQIAALTPRVIRTTPRQANGQGLFGHGGSSGGASPEEKYSDDTLKAQYLEKQRYRSIPPRTKEEFRDVKNNNKGTVVRIKTDNKIEQLSNDIDTYNTFSVEDREDNKDAILKKIKDFENDPQNPLEELEITLDDRIVFIIATFFIRYITLLMVQWCIDINIITSFYEGFIYYAVIYIILFWFVVLFINIDNSYDVKYMNFNGIINSIRSLFFYFYMGTNGISRLLIHTSLIILLIVIPIILNIKKKPEFKDEANHDDTVATVKLLNYDERKQLSKTLTLFTMFIWLFTSIIATKF